MSFDTWKTTEPAELDPGRPYEDDEDRERRWAGFEQDVLAFAASEPDGFAAVLRAVSRAMHGQRVLPGTR